MSNVRHACLYCYYNSCHGSAPKWFSTLWDNDYWSMCVCYTAAMVIMLRDSRSYDQITESLETKMEIYRHSTGSQLNGIFK
jgi:hypothetical protein